MNRLAYMTLAMTIAAHAAFTYTDPSKIDAMEAHGDLRGLQAEYANLSVETPRTPETLYELGKVTGGILTVKERQNGEKAENEKLALESIGFCREATAGTLPPEEAADCCFVAARMCKRLIRNAPTWMQYNPEKETFLKQCVQYNPKHLGAQILSATALIKQPENEGGNPAEGRTQLEKLYRENPGKLPVMVALADDLLNRGELDRASDVFAEILRNFPEYTPAQKSIDEIAIARKELPIAHIEIGGKVKTSVERLHKKVASFVGEKYTFTTKDEIRDKLSEITSISDSAIEATPIDSGTQVDILITVQENNLIVLGAIGYVNLSLDYDKDVSPDFAGGLLYSDQNFLGTSNQMNMIFAGPYLRLDYTMANVINDGGPDVKLHGESNFLNDSFIPVVDGRPCDDEGITTTSNSAAVSIGKDFPFGLSAFATAGVKYNNWKETSKNDSSKFVVPSSHLSYNPNFNVSFSTLGGGTGSKMDLVSGFAVSLQPEIIYEQDYEAWGKPDELHEHNGKPEYRFNANFTYGKKLFENQNLKFLASWHTGCNMYATEKWEAGTENPLNTEASLDGYYEEEFRYTSGLIGNIAYQINIIPTHLATYAKYDVFLNLDDSRAYNGTAIGVITKLPYDIELASQFGIGLNADRAHGIGYEFSVMLTRLWMF